jgi:hypothetical protein
MASIPLKPQYGPTLGTLLQPRWRSARPAMRALVVATVAGALALALVVVLSLLDASYSHSGRVPFSFTYKGLYRTTPEAGEYVKLVRTSRGTLRDSYAVSPLVLPRYSGDSSGELPLLATSYAHTLAARFQRFRLEGEGKTRITSSLQGYEVLYTALLDRSVIYGRDVMLLPNARAREGVVIEMLTREPATISLPVASSGVLERPLKSFTFG